MGMFKLTAKRGIDPADNIDTYLVELHDDTGAFVGAGAWTAGPETESLIGTAHDFDMAYAFGLVYLGAVDENAERILAAAKDWPVLWTNEVEGEMEEPGTITVGDDDGTDSEGGNQ